MLGERCVLPARCMAQRKVRYYYNGTYVSRSTSCAILMSCRCNVHGLLECLRRAYLPTHVWSELRSNDLFSNELSQAMHTLPYRIEILLSTFLTERIIVDAEEPVQSLCARSIQVTTTQQQMQHNSRRSPHSPAVRARVLSATAAALLAVVPPSDCANLSRTLLTPPSRPCTTPRRPAAAMTPPTPPTLDVVLLLLPRASASSNTC